MESKAGTRLIGWLALSGVVIVADQVTKMWMLSAFAPGERFALTPFFDLVLAFNSGAAFSFLAGAGGWQRWVFVVLALAISAWLIVLLRQHSGERLMPLALALILGGALGNVIDRLMRGVVVDFLDFYIGHWHWPAFNVADSAITVGVALMLWQQLTQKNPS